MKHFFATLGLGLLVTAGPRLATAQAPVLTTTVPARHALAASRTAPLELHFSQAVTGADSLRLFGSQWRGYRAGTATGDGTTTLRFQPRQVFAPGEEVSLTVPATVRGSGVGGSALAAGQVLQFRAAVTPTTGTFVQGTTQSEYLGPYYKHPVLVDVDADGRLDLLYAEPSISAIFLRRNTGTGFGPIVDYSLGQGLGGEEFVVADVNNDGRPDVLSTLSSASPWRVVVGLGNGTGSFQTSTNVVAQGIPVHPQAADVNADGYFDLLFEEHLPTANGSTPAGTTLVVCLNDRQGTFAAVTRLPLDFGAGGLHVADVNNDGLLDCLVANTSTGQLKTYLGNGTGSFALAATPPVSFPATRAVTLPLLFTSAIRAVADLTGDGNLDVLVLGPGPQSSASPDSIRLFPGTGTGGFGRGRAIAMTRPQQLQVGDLDGDGDLDLVAASDYGATNRTVSYWRNDGSGTFVPQAPLAGPATQLALGDINNDGSLDVLALDERGDANGIGFCPFFNQPAANAPTISGFSPALAPPGTTITLTGTNLGGATTVLLGGVPVSGFTSDPATGTISFVVPPGSVGGLISVLTPTGTATSAGPLYNSLPPVITSFSPFRVQAGATITVLGYNLYGATSVSVGGVNIPSFTVNPNTGIVTFVLPAGVSGGFIQIQTANGTATSALALVVLNPPTITGFSPASAPVGAVVTVRGTYLAGVTTVRVGSTAMTNVAVDATTGDLTFTIAPGTLSNYISVSTPQGSATSATRLLIVLPPQITSFSPTTTLASSVTTVTVSGSNFAGTTAVSVGGVAISNFSVNVATGMLTFTLPAGSLGGLITVTTPGGTATSATPLVVVQAPTITSFTPAAGPANAPIAVTVTGTYLAGATAVSVGGVPVSSFMANAGTVTFTLPAGSAGGLITITTPGGTVTSATALTIVLGTQAAAKGGFILYPNPTHDRVQVQLPGNAPVGVVRLLCYDALGRLVRQASVPTAAPALDVQGLAPGRYVLAVQLANEAPRYLPLRVE